MQFTANQAEVGQPSYMPGEDFTLRIRFASPAADLVAVTNVSVDLVRAEKQRNQLAFGFGNKPQIDGALLTVTQKLAIELKPGLHFVGGVTLCSGENGAVPTGFRLGPFSSLSATRIPHRLAMMAWPLLWQIWRRSGERTQKGRW
jgi:hypothetical protein